MKLDKNRKTQIIIAGRAGNGIRFFAKKLIGLLQKHDKDLYITYYYDYDSTVRGGNTEAYITIDKEDQTNGFIFRRSDILVVFDNDLAKRFKARTVLGKTGEDKGNYFEDLSMKHFNSKIQANMIALGQLVKVLDIKDYDLKADRINREAFRLGKNLKYEEG